MPGRTIAIGDTHGHARALRGLLGAIQPAADDTIVMLGDYIDRGPDSRGVIETILELGDSCHVVSLLGNHEEMLLDVLEGLEDDDFWRTVAGGEATLLSYGCKKVRKIDRSSLGVHPFVRLVVRIGEPLLRSWQLRRNASPGGPASRGACLGADTKQPTRPALFGQDGRHGSHGAKGRLCSAFAATVVH